ncbi:MAG: hypothetical protein LUQ38_12435 [Methanotrichaceae archaeon]|nr:hypothetical protein [Methanotrichaceae archaeon]
MSCGADDYLSKSVRLDDAPQICGSSNKQKGIIKRMAKAELKARRYRRLARKEAESTNIVHYVGDM